MPEDVQEFVAFICVQFAIALILSAMFTTI